MVGGAPPGRGVFYYDPSASSRGEKPIREVPGLESLRRGVTIDFHIDSKNTLWIGKFDQGLHRLNLDGLAKGNAVAERVRGITNIVGLIYEDSQGAIWTSGRYRAGAISRLKGEEVRYFSPETTDGGLPSDQVWSFQEGEDGQLYIGTAAGLARYDGKRFTTLEGTADRPVPSGYVFRIIRDRGGVLWFASESGLFRYDGITWSSLDEEDGLPSLLVQTITQGNDGAYWIGTDKGITCYRPTQQKLPPPQLIVKTDEERGGAKSIPAVAFGQLVGFRFNAVDFKTQPFRRFYRCAIVPGHAETPPAKRDSAWREPTLATQFDWNPKAPGDYTFFVQSIDRDLNYSEPTRAFLRIVTPWYANAWIIGACWRRHRRSAGWAFLARSLYMRKRREAEQLREQLLREEHDAREAAEKAKADMEAKNSQLEAAKEAAETAREQSRIRQRRQERISGEHVATRSARR